MASAALIEPFRWRRRMRRRQFALNLLLSVLAFAVLFVFIERVAGRAATLMLYPFFFAYWLALMVRRLHDQARSPLWLLALLIPLLGPLLVGWLLLFARGTPGDNQHGDDPRTVGRDYLQVRIDAT
jgi:uncharacterized membrane protein YhaH (DUF805 family)